MSFIAVVIIAISIVAFGIYDCLKYKKDTKTLEETVNLLKLFKNEINYRKADFYNLICIGENQGYKNIQFADGKIIPFFSQSSVFSKDFIRFSEQIGTTDAMGQVELCDEYIEKFSTYFEKQKSKEEAKIQVNLSLSVLGAVSLLIIFV